MFFAQIKLGSILPAGHYLFSLLETFHAAPFLCKGRQAVSHLTDPDAPLQTKGCNCLECCFRPLGLFFFSHFVSLLQPHAVGELKSQCSIMGERV